MLVSINVFRVYSWEWHTGDKDGIVYVRCVCCSEVREISGGGVVDSALSSSTTYESELVIRMLLC